MACPLGVYGGRAGARRGSWGVRAAEALAGARIPKARNKKEQERCPGPHRSARREFARAGAGFGASLPARAEPTVPQVVAKEKQNRCISSSSRCTCTRQRLGAILHPMPEKVDLRLSCPRRKLLFVVGPGRAKRRGGVGFTHLEEGRESGFGMLLARCHSGPRHPRKKHGPKTAWALEGKVYPSPRIVEKE